MGQGDSCRHGSMVERSLPGGSRGDRQPRLEPGPGHFHPAQGPPGAASQLLECSLILGQSRRASQRAPTPTGGNRSFFWSEKKKCQE